jgi:acyl-CoA reductase LuxC
VIVEQLVPRACTVEVEAVLEMMIRAERASAEPFHPLRIAFADGLSRAIFSVPRARSFPDVLAAAFWVRRAAVMRLAEAFAATQTTRSFRAPRGLVFHVPPANVGTLFIYPLLASLLVGNLNIVRVSRDRPTPQVALLCEVLRTLLAEDRFAELRDELAVLAYGHEEEPTAAISRNADVRLLWGGDQTIERLRSVPISAAAHELTFGDRFSYAVLRPEALLDADQRSCYALAGQLFNDSYWFDQLACASPRVLIWVGEADRVAAARELLLASLAQVIADKGYRLQPGAAIAKLTFAYGALIDRPIDSFHRVGNELVVLRLKDLEDFDRSHPGAGLFFEARVDTLSDLVSFVHRKDQTLTAHGFDAAELADFARSLRGRGIDRIVRFGDALAFDSLWDGYDLMAELTRTIAIPEAA